MSTIDDGVEIDLETGLEVNIQPENPNPGGGDEVPPSNSESLEALGEDEHNEEHLDPDADPDDDPEPQGTEDEREAIRQRRREERRNRKEAQRERENSLRRELASRDAVINELRSKVDVIERRNNGSELAALDNAKRNTVQAYNYFKNQIQVATEAGNGAAVAEATEKLMQAQRRFDEIQAYEKALKSQQSAPSTLDPRLVENAQAWMKRNPWYNAQGSDTDSVITTTLDRQLQAEGWDPTQPSYFEELDSRLKKYLPHRASRGKISTTKPRSVVTGSSREASTASTKGSQTYRLSADRVQALKEAGIWDDPKARAEAIKRYRDYDKQQSNQG